MKQLRKHQTGEDDEVQAGQHRWQPLVIADEAAEARAPREVPLDNQPQDLLDMLHLQPADADSWARFDMAYSYSVCVWVQRRRVSCALRTVAQVILAQTLHLRRDYGLARLDRRHSRSG